MDDEKDELQINFGRPTLRNEDLIRQSYAMKTYARNLKNTIGYL